MAAKVAHMGNRGKTLFMQQWSFERVVTLGNGPGRRPQSTSSEKDASHFSRMRAERWVVETHPAGGNAASTRIPAGAHARRLPPSEVYLTHTTDRLGIRCCGYAAPLTNVRGDRSSFLTVIHRLESRAGEIQVCATARQGFQ